MPVRCKIFLITLFLINNSYGQAIFGKLTVKAKFNKAYTRFWDSIYLKNKDTTFRFAFDNGKKKNSYTVPSGKYTVTLKSLLRGVICKEVMIKKRTTLKFNAAPYYQAYKDTVSLMDLMAVGDTCAIYYLSGLSWALQPDYFYLVREKLVYKVVIKNEYGDWVWANVMDYEFNDIRKLGKYVLPDNSESLPTLETYYYWALGNKVLRNNCGTCMYGFLLRKRLVKMP